MNVEETIKTKRQIPLTKRTIIHLALVNNKLNDAIGIALKPYEVSLQQFNVLRILRGLQGAPANLSTLNERMVSKMSNTTRLVDKLLSKGYAERNVCQTNRRKVEIFITEEGKHMLTKMDHAVKTVEDEALKNLSERDLNLLNQLLDKF